MPITVDPAFIKNTKQPGNSLLIVVAIEDLDTRSDSLDSQQDWEGSPVRISIDTTSQVGDAINQLITPATLYSLVLTGDQAQTYQWRSTLAATTNYHLRTWFLEFLNYPVYPAASPRIRPVTFYIRTGSHTGPVIFTELRDIEFNRIDGEFGFMHAENISIFPNITLNAATAYYFEATTFDVNGPDITGDRIEQGVTTFSLTSKLSFITTSTLDLGSIPISDVVFSADDIKEFGASIEYTLLGGNVDPPTNNLGVVIDGQEVTGYRYYDVDAEFISSGGGRGILQRLELSTSEKNYIVNHPVSSLPTARTLLLPAPLRETSSKLDREKPVSVGEMSVQMAWTAWLGGIIHDEFLRGKDVSIDLGYEGMVFSQFAPFFTGTWFDYKADHVKGIINVQLRDALDQWRKVKLPKETSDSDGNKTTAPIVYTDENIFDVMLDLFDKIGFPDRYIARDQFEFLRDVEFPFDDYNVTRTLTKPIEAFQLLNELSVISGVFLVPYADGKIYPIVYDPNTPEAAVFDANFMDFQVIKGGYKDLFTRQLIYFDPSVAEPGGDEDDYASLYIDLDATVETLWDESNEKRWFEKWNASFVLVSSLANRFHSWFANPKKAFDVDKANLGNIEVQPGDVVHINNLHIPVTEADFPGTTDGVHCLILNRSLNASNGSLSYSMIEIEEPLQCFANLADVVVGNATGSIADTVVRDGSYYAIQEVVGVPGFEVVFRILCPTPIVREFVFWGRYQGNPAHIIKVQAYDWNSDTWFNFRATATTDFPSSSTDYFLRLPFIFNADFFLFFEGEYRVEVRIIHVSSGNTTHDFYIDQMFLR